MVLKLLNVYLLATVKYFFSFPYALLLGLNYDQAMFVVMIGGISGFFFFYYMSGLLIKGYQRYQCLLCKLVPGFVKKRYQSICEFSARLQGKNRFTRKNRMLIRIKTKYGLWGIIISSPILLSIPLGAFLLKKYYSETKNVFGYMIISIVGWAAFFSVITIIFPNLI